MLADYYISLSVGAAVAVAVVLGHWILFMRSRAMQTAMEPATPTPSATTFTASATEASAPEAANPTQKRVSLRRNGNPILIHVALPGQTENPFSAYVLDRSLGGLGMSIDKPFDPGTILVVRPAAALEMTPWYEIEILRCQNTGEGWHASCRFIKTPPYSILLLFG